MKEVRLGDKVSIEDEDKLPLCRREPRRQSSCFESRPVLPVDEFGVPSLLLPPFDPIPGQVGGFIRGVI